MSKKNSPKPDEITSFNEELVTFDVEDLEVEELERRFELAIGAIYSADSCGVMSCQQVVCDELDCGVFTSPPAP